MEGTTLSVVVSPFSGYSLYYTEDLVDRIETTIRKMLDDELGYLNDKKERNYEINREDWVSTYQPDTVEAHRISQEMRDYMAYGYE